jgi:hypothetical protein
MIAFAKFCAVSMALLGAVAFLAGALGQADEQMHRCSVVRCT